MSFSALSVVTSKQGYQSCQRSPQVKAILHIKGDRYVRLFVQPEVTATWFYLLRVHYQVRSYHIKSNNQVRSSVLSEVIARQDLLSCYRLQPGEVIYHIKGHTQVRLSVHMSQMKGVMWCVLEYHRSKSNRGHTNVRISVLSSVTTSWG